MRHIFTNRGIPAGEYTFEVRADGTLREAQYYQPAYGTWLPLQGAPGAVRYLYPAGSNKAPMLPGEASASYPDGNTILVA